MPAHVDREANGILAVLGDLPEHPAFPTVEYREPASAKEFEAKYPRLIGKRRIVSSDAHRLCDISEGGYPLPLPCKTGADAETVRRALIRYLAGG